MAELPDLEVFARILTRRYGGKVLEKIDIPVDKKLNVPSKKMKTAQNKHKTVLGNKAPGRDQWLFVFRLKSLFWAKLAISSYAFWPWALDRYPLPALLKKEKCISVIPI